MRIPYYVKSGSALDAGVVTTMLDQSAADSFLPTTGVYKETIEFDVPIFAWQYCRKAQNPSGIFRDKDVPGFDLVERQRDRIGVRNHGFAVPWIIDGRAELQGFKGLLFSDGCSAY
jgi:hypothetical protein